MVTAGLFGAGLGFAKMKPCDSWLAWWKTADTGVKVAIDFIRHNAAASHTLWCLYFLICFYFLYWPVNALSLLFGIVLKQRTAAR